MPGHVDCRTAQEENSAAALDAYLAPLVSGLDEDAASLPYPSSISLRDYIDMVRTMAEATVAPTVEKPSRTAAWLARIVVLGKRQRAYGPQELLATWTWTRQRGLQLRETPLVA